MELSSNLPETCVQACDECLWMLVYLGLANASIVSSSRKLQEDIHLVPPFDNRSLTYEKHQWGRFQDMVTFHRLQFPIEELQRPKHQILYWICYMLIPLEQSIWWEISLQRERCMCHPKFVSRFFLNFFYSFFRSGRNKTEFVQNSSF